MLKFSLVIKWPAQMTETLDNIEAIIKGHLDFKERYSDLCAIGLGGDGVVFRVKDNKLDKWVAIKVLLGGSDSKSVIRFQQEARTLSLLKHRYIVSVLDFQCSKRAELFLIMEYIDGISLAQRVEEHGPLPLDEVVKYAIQLCEALNHAHAQGVVHRDLKPSNIMIDGQGNVKILDFGIAQLTTPNQQLGTITRLGVPVGSPAFMSPEQVRGDVTDERTDVFGLGLLIYVMAAGRSPFDADQVLDYYQNLIGETLPSLRLWIGESAAAHKLDALVAKAMKSDQKERFQTIGEVRSALDLLAAEPVEVLQVSHGPTVATTSKSGRVLFTLISLLLFGGLIVFGVVSFFFASPEQPGATSSIKNKNGVAQLQDSRTSKSEILSGSSSATDRKPVRFNQDSVQDLNALKFDDVKVKTADLGSLDPKTKYLSLSDSTLTFDMIDTLSRMRLQALDLSKTNINDTDLKKIADIKTLRWLRLNHTNITRSGIANLAPLKVILSKLDLDSCKGINDEAISYIVQNVPNLESLQITETSVRSKGIKELSKMKNLKRLYLTSLPITDEDVKAISTLNIEFLDLSCCAKLTEETLNILSPHKNLKYLDLTNCLLINSELVEKWKKARRGTTVIGGNNDVYTGVAEDLFKDDSI